MRKELVRGQGKNGVGRRKLENRNHLKKIYQTKLGIWEESGKSWATKNKIITPVLSDDLSSVDTFIAHCKQLNKLQLECLYGHPMKR